MEGTQEKNERQQTQINGCVLPKQFDEYDEETKQNVTDYLMQLNTIEIQAYNIAKIHLKSSFNILRSNGYNNWLNSLKK
jgi:hypothetical protein